MSLKERSSLLKQPPSEAYTQATEPGKGMSLHDRIEMRRAEQKAFRLNNSQPELETMDADISGQAYGNINQSFQEPVPRWEPPAELQNKR